MNLNIKRVLKHVGMVVLVFGVISGGACLVIGGYGLYVSQQIISLAEIDGGVSVSGRLSFFLYAMVCVGGLTGLTLCLPALIRTKSWNIS